MKWIKSMCYFLMAPKELLNVFQIHAAFTFARLLRNGITQTRTATIAEVYAGPCQVNPFYLHATTAF